MARTQEYAYREGTLKIPELVWDIVDGRTFVVAEEVGSADITGGDFTIKTTGTLDVSGDDSWPAAGHVCINGCLYTYDSISGSNFVDCNGSYNDVTADTINADDMGYQGIPATVINGIIQALTPLMVYVAYDLDWTPDALTITIADGILFDGTSEYEWIEATENLTDDATNYVYAVIQGSPTGVDVGVNVTSWASAETAEGSTIYPLAKITTSSGEITAYQDCRVPFIQRLDTGGAVDELVDADGDTRIQVEESTDEDKIRFDIAGTEREVLDDTVVEFKRSNNTAANCYEFRFTRGHGTDSTPSAVQQYDELGQVTFYGYKDGSTPIVGAEIYATALENFDATHSNTRLNFATAMTPALGLVPRLIIDDDCVTANAAIEASTNYICNNNVGVTTTYDVVTDVDVNTQNVKYRTITVTGGIITTVSAESGWTPAPLNP